MTEEQNSINDTTRRKKALEWGKIGENLTKEYLLQKGFAVTAENWRCGSLEIDLISEQGDEMVFIEVKTRNGRFERAEDAVDPKKIRRIVRAANAFLNMQSRDYTARFDVALVEGDPQNHSFTYIENAFYPPLSTR